MDDVVIDEIACVVQNRSSIDELDRLQQVRTVAPEDVGACSDHPVREVLKHGRGTQPHVRPQVHRDDDEIGDRPRPRTESTAGARADSTSAPAPACAMPAPSSTATVSSKPSTPKSAI